MPVVIGSARIDERGKISGGAAGDQKQTGQDDYKGEVSLQKFYAHAKGWHILRPKYPEDAVKIAERMKAACNNPNIGYDQNERLGVISKGIDTAVKTECDCSSLVRACVKEATGKDPGNFTTANEVEVLEKSGLFEPRRSYVMGSTLYVGDVLVTKTKGHTVIVVDGAKRKGTQTPEKSTEKSITDISREVIAGKWGNGVDRRNKLSAMGYDPVAVQEEVNRLLKQ